MALLFTLHLSKHKDGFGKPCVNSEPSVTSHGGLYNKERADFFKPKADDVRECLPHYYRAAFDRATAWVSEPQGFIYWTLNDTRGRYLNTLYAYPYEFNA